MGIERFIPDCPELMWRTGRGGWGVSRGQPLSYLCGANNNYHAYDLCAFRLDELEDLLEKLDQSKVLSGLSYTNPSWFQSIRTTPSGLEVVHQSRHRDTVYRSRVTWEELEEVVAIVKGVSVAEIRKNRKTAVELTEKDKEYAEVGAISLLDIE